MGNRTKLTCDLCWGKENETELYKRVELKHLLGEDRTDINIFWDGGGGGGKNKNFGPGGPCQFKLR